MKEQTPEEKRIQLSLLKACLALSRRHIKIAYNNKMSCYRCNIRIWIGEKVIWEYAWEHSHLKCWFKYIKEEMLKDGLLHQCPACRSWNTRKKGFSHTKDGKFQKHRCKDCSHTFVDDKNLL